MQESSGQLRPRTHKSDLGVKVGEKVAGVSELVVRSLHFASRFRLASQSGNTIRAARRSYVAKCI